MLEARLTELNINEVLLYLGYRGQEIDDRVNKQIEDCIAKVKAAALPKLVWRRLPLRNGKLREFELEGRDIEELLRESSEAVIFAATLGAKVEKLMIRYEVSNMADALIMDSAASVAIENVCNNFEQDMRESLEKEGLFLTDRFSPGYGDLPLSTQKDMIASLNTEKRIGLTLSKSNLMIPRKSVTAIMGISKTKQIHRQRGCESCKMFRTCASGRRT